MFLNVMKSRIFVNCASELDSNHCAGKSHLVLQFQSNTNIRMTNSVDPDETAC